MTFFLDVFSNLLQNFAIFSTFDRLVTFFGNYYNVLLYKKFIPIKFAPLTFGTLGGCLCRLCQEPAPAFSASAYDRRWPIICVAGSSFHGQCKVTVLIKAELDRERRWSQKSKEIPTLAGMSTLFLSVMNLTVGLENFKNELNTK